MYTMSDIHSLEIKVIIGLGNPGSAHYYQRHSIGFRILDALAQEYTASWAARPLMELAEATIGGAHTITLIKPQTYMNDSGKVLPFLLKKGIKAENILVIHDELELPFGKLAFKVGGSAKGHNGLKSIISVIGSDFARLRVGIGRPDAREDVPSYVLSSFDQPKDTVDQMIEQAVVMLEELFKK